MLVSVQRFNDSALGVGTVKQIINKSHMVETQESSRLFFVPVFSVFFALVKTFLLEISEDSVDWFMCSGNFIIMDLL